MDFNSERYATIVNAALSVKQDIFEQLEDILETKDVTEDDAVIFFSALSLLCKISSQISRALSPRPPEQIKQLLREDVVRAKIILQNMSEELLQTLRDETGKDEIAQYLKEVDFFEYPDKEVDRWDVKIYAKLDRASDIAQ